MNNYNVDNHKGCTL